MNERGHKTSQINDGFLFEEMEYKVSAIEYPEKFINIYSLLGFKPNEFHTACWRGFIATYAIFENKLVLKNLYTNNASNLKNKAPKLNNILPDISIDEKWVSEETRKNRREFNYKNINLEIPYTGSIIINKNFILERYVHMGFQSPFSYETVIQIIFDDGKLIFTKDLSNIAKIIRENNKISDISFDKLDDKKWLENKLKWINDSFDLSFTSKVNDLLDDEI